MKYTLLFILATGLLIGCNEPTDVGDDIIDRDGILTNLNDDFQIRARTIEDDSVLVRLASGQSSGTHFLGKLNDPVNGISTSEINVEYALRSLGYDVGIDAELDSVVLSMTYDSTEHYGDLNDIVMDFSVFELDEQIQEGRDYYSNETYRTYPNPIADIKNKQVDLEQGYVETEINEDGELDTLNVFGPQLRLHLNSSIGEKILAADSFQLLNPELFTKYFNGLKIKAEAENTMLAFSMGFSSNSKLVVYYHEGEERKRIELVTTAVNPVTNRFTEDYTNSLVGDILDSYDSGDSILVVGGMGGTNAEVNFENIQELENKIINYAEIKVYLNEEASLDQEIYPPLVAISLSYINSEGERVAIIDSQRADATQDPETIDDFFGGYIMENDNVKSYTMKFTEFAQSLVDDPDLNSMLINARYKASNSERTVLYGPNHSEFPFEIRVFYSEQN